MAKTSKPPERPSRKSKQVVIKGSIGSVNKEHLAGILNENGIDIPHSKSLSTVSNAIRFLA